MADKPAYQELQQRVKELEKEALEPKHPEEAKRELTCAFEQSIDITGNAAILVHFGLPNEDDVIHVPALSTHTMDKEIRFSWLAPLSWPETIRAISEGLVDVEALTTSTVPLDDAELAIRDLKERIGDPLKVQVTP